MFGKPRPDVRPSGQLADVGLHPFTREVFDPSQEVFIVFGIDGNPLWMRKHLLKFFRGPVNHPKVAAILSSDSVKVGVECCSRAF